MKILIWLVMAMAMNEGQAAEDGDPAFWRVDTRTPAHQLPAGVAADATNKRFDDGKAAPRLGISQQEWGRTGVNLAQNTVWAGVTDQGNSAEVDGFIVGQHYYFRAGGTAYYFQTADPNGGEGEEIWMPGQTWVATSPTGSLQDQNNTVTGTPTGAIIVKVTPTGNEQGCLSYDDPDGYKTMVVATDDWRNLPGEDGGRGRVYKVLANNPPVLVPLNGHDIYCPVRFLDCQDALILLRNGNERHYFPAVNVGSGAGGPGANLIQLNCEPDWASGDQCYLWGDVTTASQIEGTTAPVINSFVYVSMQDNNQIELYADSGLTQQLLFTGATGRFYLERRAANPGPFGNGAWPLMAQPNAAGNTLWEVGFDGVPVNLEVTAVQEDSPYIWTVPNHRLAVGDAVVLSGMTSGQTPANGTYYVLPVNANALVLYDTQADAELAANGSTQGRESVDLDSADLTAVMVKQGASGMPMPPAIGGVYTEQGLTVLFSGNTVYISDPLDPLHYSPQSATLPANLSDSSPIVAIAEFVSSNSLVILKQKSILGLYNLSGGASAWLLQGITKEYGCLSDLTVREWGARLLFVSRRGLDSVEYTAFGVIIPRKKPVSYDFTKYVNLINWDLAGSSCLEIWNNRVFWALPLKTAAPGTGNNAVATIACLNSEPLKDTFAWEGIWTGTYLAVAGWAKHTIAGEERLAYTDASGLVYWLTDGRQDVTLLGPAAAIQDSLTTRRYSAKNGNRKIWQQMLANWDTNAALLTVTAVGPGFNELTVLSPAGGFAYNPLAYDAGVNTVYNPATQQPAFNTPYREDYALQNVTELIGGQPDVLQNHIEPWRTRQDSWGIQFIIANANGTCVVRAVEVSGFYGPAANRRLV